MKTTTSALQMLFVLLFVNQALADVTVFFNISQVASQVATGATADTISSEGYRFTYSRDKFFTGGVGLTNPIGRTVRVPWPQGVEAQALTTGPLTNGANITITREDGRGFDLTAFTAKLLANTAGTGGSIEIMPTVNGEDALNDPVMFDASGYYGSTFSYNTTFSYLGTTAALTNYPSYKIHLFVDYALTALTLEAVTPHTNHPPADLALSSSAILENEPPWTTVGTVSTSDPDVTDTFTYSLVPGAGDTDNALFDIWGVDLVTAMSFNFEVQSNYSVRIETMDQDFLATQKVFQVSVLDVDETPVLFAPYAEGGKMVLSWSSVPDHLYNLLVSTNLQAGFVVRESNIPATPDVNVYTNIVQDSPALFWKVSTVP